MSLGASGMASSSIPKRVYCVHFNRSYKRQLRDNAAARSIVIGGEEACSVSAGRPAVLVRLWHETAVKGRAEHVRSAPLQHLVHLIEVKVAEQGRDDSALWNALLARSLQHNLQKVHDVRVVYCRRSRSIFHLVLLRPHVSPRQGLA